MKSIPDVNNRKLETMKRNSQIIPICSDELCYKVRLDGIDAEYWTDNYNHQIVVGYTRLSHGLCPPHLKEQYIINGLEEFLEEDEL